MEVEYGLRIIKKEMEQLLHSHFLYLGTQHQETAITDESKTITAGTKKILAVDDEPDLTMICSLALEYYGFKVDTFNDPQEALSKFKPGYYDLVILDIKMPKMDGFEMYDRLKEKDNDVKVCFLTASELYYEEFRRKEYSALDKNLFIKKPIDNEDLLRGQR